MSGGSFNYLYAKSPDELIEMTDTIKRMRDRLVELKAPRTCVEQTERVLDLIERFWSVMTVRISSLEGVWHGVEWYDSNDWGLDQVQEVFQQFEDLKEE